MKMNEKHLKEESEFMKNQATADNIFNTNTICNSSRRNESLLCSCLNYMRCGDQMEFKTLSTIIIKLL